MQFNLLRMWDIEGRWGPRFIHGRLVMDVRIEVALFKQVYGIGCIQYAGWDSLDELCGFLEIEIHVQCCRLMNRSSLHQS